MEQDDRLCDEVETVKGILEMQWSKMTGYVIKWKQ